MSRGKDWKGESAHKGGGKDWEGGKVGVHGVGKRPNDQAEERGWLGHEGAFKEEGDVYGDHEHMQTHRVMHKDGTFHLNDHKPEGWEEKERSEFHQEVEPHEMRFKHKERNAGVILGARSGANHEEWEGVDVHTAQNKYMHRGAAGGAKRPWRTKGREAAERASRDV